MEISRHMGIGDIETHTDRPRHFWGIGSRLGHPSKYQNRPRTRRNHITASRTMFHTPIYGHMGEIPPSFDGIAQKQNARGRGGERDGSGMGGWLPWRGTVQYPQYPGGVTAAVISQSKLFIFYHVIFYSFQPHSCVKE